MISAFTSSENTLMRKNEIMFRANGNYIKINTYIYIYNPLGSYCGDVYTAISRWLVTTISNDTPYSSFLEYLKDMLPHEW